jgi:hypothetical protein
MQHQQPQFVGAQGQQLQHFAAPAVQQQQVASASGVQRQKKKKKAAGAQGVPPVQQPHVVVSTGVAPPQGQFVPQGHQAGFDMQTSQLQAHSQAAIQPQIVAQVMAPLVSEHVVPIETVKPNKPIWCWKCSVDSHAVKDCKAQHYCYICDKKAHPTVRCPVLKYPRPSAFVAGVGTYETFFTTLPDSVVKDDLVPNSSPVARVVVTGEAVTTVVIQKQMARRCPAKPQWKWEAVPHGDNVFLISFPSFEDLDVVDGIQMAVPGFNSQMSVSVWKPTDVPHKFELEQVWLHVEGVPHNVRHFWGLWAVGSLMGKTLDVDLLSLRRRGVVRVLVAMFDTTKFGKKDAATFVKSDVVVKLKGYEFRFSRESPSYVPEADFVPFVWRKKDGDGDGGKGKEHEDAMDTSEFAQGTSDTVMHQAQGSSSSTVAPVGSSQVAAVLHAVTPFNSDPKTPRGIALVAALRKSHPSLERRSPTALVGSDMQPPLSLVDGHFSSKAVTAEELSVALSSVSSPSQRLVVQDVASEALAKKVQVTPSTSRGRRNVLGRTRPSPPPGDAALASHPAHGPGGGQLLPAHAGVDGGEQQIPAVGEQQLTVVGEQRLKSVSEQKHTYVREQQLTCAGEQQLTSMCEHALKYVGEKQFTSAPLEHGQRVAGAAPAGRDGEQQLLLAADQTERHGPARGCVGEQQLPLTADQPVSRGPASGVSLPGAVADRVLRLEMVVPREGKGGSSEAVATVGSEPTVAAIAPSSPPLATTPRSPTVTTGRVSTPTSPSPVVTPLRQPLHATPSRRSMRQVTATDGALASDEDSLSRAMRRKAASNLDSTGSEPSSKSFLNFSTQSISAKLNSVGVSLGSSVGTVNVSANALRHMEFDRLKVTPKVSSKPDISPVDEDELYSDTDGQLLSHLVGEVSEVGLDEAVLNSVYDLKASSRKSKSSSTKKTARPSKKAKVSKSTVVS